MSLLEPGVRRGDLDPNIYGHSRTRTTSSGAFSYDNQNPGYLAQPYGSYHTRNTPSTNTFSTNTFSTNTFSSAGSTISPPPQAPGYRPTQSSDLRRSTSSRSGASIVMQGSGYVALLRKQKATVWCDRPQAEDPTILAQRTYARARAQQELWDGLGGSAGYSSATVGSGGRTSTGLGSNKMGKIRHNKPALHDYIPGENHVGAGGVPMRLSATEVEGESSDDDSSSKLHHRRTGSSGRSSIGSARRGAAYRSGGLGGSQSSRRRSPDGTPDGAGSVAEEKVEGDGRPPSFKSGDDEAEMMDNVGELGAASRLASKSLMHAAMTRDKGGKTIEDLKRRGSVDDRTMSLSSGRLFIANPD